MAGETGTETEDRADEGYLKVEEILSARDLVEEDVECPEWGGKIRIRGLTVEAQDEYRKRATVKDEVDQNLAARYLFIASVVRPRFTADRVEQLSKKAAAPFNRVIKRCLVINGLTEEATQEAAKSFPDGSA